MSNGCRSLTIPDLDEINIIGRLKTLVRAYNIVEQWGEGWESSRGFAPNCVCHLRCGMVYPKLFRTWVHNILRRLLCSRCIFYVIHLVTRVLVRRNQIHQMLMDTMVHSLIQWWVARREYIRVFWLYPIMEAEFEMFIIICLYNYSFIVDVTYFCNWLVNRPLINW